MDDAGRTFTAEPELVAVDGQRAVVFVEVAYGDPVEQEYRDLWLFRFADDGRVDDFEEWAYWPDKPYTGSRRRLDQLLGRRIGTVEEGVEHIAENRLRAIGKVEGHRRAQLHRVDSAEDLLGGTPGVCGGDLRTLDQPGPEHGMSQYARASTRSAIAYALAMALCPSPAIWGTRTTSSG